MESLFLLTLTMCLMFTGGQCYSESISCSTVNGQMVCESQKGPGNFAGAASHAMTGQSGSYQDASAMTGSTYTGQSSSSRTSAGNPTGGAGSGFNPFTFVFGRGGNPFSFVFGSGFPFGRR